MKWMAKVWLVMALAWSPLGALPLTSEQTIDLDGDGTLERVGLVEFGEQGVTYGQLTVTDWNGEVLWQAPRNAEDFVFLGEFDRGLVEAVYRDGGQVYLLGSYQKSDVRPTRFRLFLWNGSGFDHLRSGSLLPQEQRPGTFGWNELGASVWIESFDGSTEDGILRARVTNLMEREQSDVLLRPVGDEYIRED